MSGFGSQLCGKWMRLSIAGVLAFLLSNALQSNQARAQPQDKPTPAAKTQEASKPDKPAAKTEVAAKNDAAAKDLPKADAILDRYVEVTGGKAAYEKIKNRISTGTFEVPAQKMTGSIKIYQAAPNKMYTSLDIPNLGLNEEGSDGAIAWEKNAMMGPRLKDGEEKATALHQAVFNADVEWRKQYKSVKTVATEDIDGHTTFKVELVPTEGNTEYRYFDKESGLALRSSTILSTQMGDMPVESTISDYKKVDGINMAHKTTIKVPMQELVITISKVEHNVDIAKDRFDPPADVKELIEKQKAAATDKPKTEPTATEKDKKTP